MAGYYKIQAHLHKLFAIYFSFIGKLLGSTMVITFFIAFMYARLMYHWLVGIGLILSYV